MKTAEEILSEYEHIEGWDLYASWESAFEKKTVLEAMKQIAELAFDAGFDYSAEQMIDALIEVSNPKPGKEQFINQLFNQNTKP